MFRTRAIEGRMLTYLALCGMAMPFIFTVLLIVAGAQYEGYSHASQAISELGGVEAKHPFIQNSSFTIAGVLIMAFALGLHRGIGQGHGSRSGLLLVGYFGVIAAVAQPLLHCDAGCEFETLTGTMHNVTGMSGFLALITGIILVSRRTREDPNWRSYSGYSLFSGLAGLLALVMWIAVAKAAGVDGMNGVLQRVFVAVVFLWIGVMASRLFWLTRRASSAEPSEMKSQS